LTRWGAYTAMVVDPTDDCTFWYTNEYIPADGSYNWSTRIASFRFPSCGGPPADFSIAAAPSALTIGPGSAAVSTIGTTVTSGGAQTVALTAAGLPAGAAASFNPSSISAGSSSTLTIDTCTAVPG